MGTHVLQIWREFDQRDSRDSHSGFCRRRYPLGRRSPFRVRRRDLVLILLLRWSGASGFLSAEPPVMRSIPLGTSGRASPTQYCPLQARGPRIGATPSCRCSGHSLEAGLLASFCGPSSSNDTAQHWDALYPTIGGAHHTRSWLRALVRRCDGVPR